MRGGSAAEGGVGARGGGFDLDFCSGSCFIVDFDFSLLDFGSASDFDFDFDLDFDICPGPGSGLRGGGMYSLPSM